MKLVDNFLNLISQSQCLLCNSTDNIVKGEDIPLCKSCKLLIEQFRKAEKCSFCSHPVLPDKGECPHCSNIPSYPEKANFSSNISILPYYPIFKENIGLMKYNKNDILYHFMISLCFTYLSKNKDACNLIKTSDYISYVPLSFMKKARRSYLITKKFTCLLSKKFNKISLSLFGEKGYHYSHLDRNNRFRIGKNRFYLKKIKYDLNNCSLLLIDDIFTTGTTLNHLSSLVKQNYPFCTVNTLTLFRTIRMPPSSGPEQRPVFPLSAAENIK